MWGQSATGLSPHKRSLGGYQLGVDGCERVGHRHFGLVTSPCGTPGNPANTSGLELPPSALRFELTGAWDLTDRENESEAAQADRRYNELLQELRVAQTGVQFLFAFLLTLAFTQRFPQITEFQQWLYIVTLILASVAAALLMAPVPTHRILYRRGLKPRLVAAADRMVRAGLPVLVLAINGAILLVLDVVLEGWLPFLLTALTTLWFVFVWYVVPMNARER